MSIIGLPNLIAGTISMCDTTHHGQVAPGSLLPREGKRLWEKYFIAKNAMQVRPRIDDVHRNHSWPDLAFNRARIANVAHVGEATAAVDP